jgi:V/A-type H+-transporting ATPase subunit F
VKEIAVVGSEDFTIGFALAGVRKRVVTVDPGEAEHAIGAVLESREAGILVVDAKEAERLSPSIRRRLAASLDPVVVQLGGEGGGDLRDKVRRAIGIDLYKE